MRVDRAARTRDRAAPTPVASERRAGANDRERRRSRRRAATRADPRRARDPGRARRARATTRAAPRRAPVRGWAMMMRELSPSRGTRAGSRTRGETHLRVIVVVAGHLDPPGRASRPGALRATASGDARARRAGGSGSRSAGRGQNRARRGGAGVLFDAYEMSQRKQSPKSVNSTMDSRSSLRKKKKTRRRVFSPPITEFRPCKVIDRPMLVFFAAAGSRAAIQAHFSSCTHPLFTCTAHAFIISTPPLGPFHAHPPLAPRRLFPPLGPITSKPKPPQSLVANCTPYLYFFDVSTCTERLAVVFAATSPVV